MNKLLNIKCLTATLAVFFALCGCNNSGNSNVKNAESDQNQVAAGTQNQQNDGQENPSEQVIQKQEELKEDPEAEPVAAEEVMEAYSCPSELKFCPQSSEYLYEKFYPIGWSKNGLFAYIIEPVDEAAGQYFFKFVIK